MTAPTDNDRGAASVPDRVLSIELPPAGTGERAARRAARAAAEARRQAPLGEREPDSSESPAEGRRAAGKPTTEVGPARPSRSFLVTFVLGLTVCAVLAVALTLVGVRTLRDSTAGRTVVSAEPDEPGFEGFLEPTPTIALFDEREGILQSVTLLSLNSGDAGGSVVLIPARTRVGSSATLDYSFAFGAPLDQMRENLEIVTAVGINEAMTTDAAAWADLVAPVAPIEVNNPDAILGFDAGPIQLGPEDVGPWLGSSDPDEDDLARLFRHQIFWEAWIAAVSESDLSTAVPGEVDSGLGRFIRGLATGPLNVNTLPVAASPDADGVVAYDVDRQATRSLMTTAVPFPLGTRAAPRVHVRLLDGTGNPDLVGLAAPTVVSANASIVVVGNADHFEYAETQIRYHQPEHRGAAEQIRAELGAGRIIEDVRPIDSFGVTIILGTDI